jgi:hypothetical protein
MPTFNRSFNGGGSRAVVTDLEVDPSDSTVSVDETNNRLGIGTTTPGTQLELDGETPYITLKNSTAENTDGGCETKLIFEDHAAASLGQIEVNHSGSADDTKGKMILSTHTGVGLTAAVTIDDTQKASFSGNVDITGGLSFDAGTAVTSIDTDISSVSGSDDTLASAKAIKTYVDNQTTDLASEVTGTLPVANGGTGATSLTDNSVLTGTGTSAVTAESKLTFDGQTLLINTDVTDTTTHTTVGAHIDYDATGIVATGQTGTNVGLDVDLNSNSPTMVGTVNNTGLDIDLTGGTSGTQKNVGIDVNVTGADTNYSAILNGGNVGIGTSAPSTLVHAAGSDPYLALQNTTAENTDGGCESRIIFDDHSDATLGRIQVSHQGSSDDTKGKMTLSVHSGSSLLDTIEMKEGNITKLGQSSPSSGQFLKYDGSKWVADTVSGTVAGSVAADDITAGDAAINLTNTTGNITIDAQAGDANIIFKGTDGSSDITALTLSMADAGAAAFNAAVSVGTDLTVTGGDIAFGATNSSVTVGATAHDAAGANLTVSAGSTTALTSDDQAGGSLTISGGQGKGTGAGGDIVFKTANAGSSGSSLNSLATALTISDDLSSTFAGVVDITNTTDATDATGDTGALRVEGGVSVAKKLFVGTDADIDGTLEADAITVDGTTLIEYIQDAVGGMVTGNTETGISVTYVDDDGTLDFAVATVATASIADDAVTVAKIEDLARGNIIYGNNSGETAKLAPGSANQVLTSDGTDISWQNAAGGGGTAADDVNLLLHQQVFGR